MNKLSALIAYDVRVAVTSGRVSDGERLGGEPDLAAAFGVSRATLRESLRILEAQGWVVLRRGPRGGVFARRPTSRNLAAALGPHLELAGAKPADISAAATMIAAVAAGLGPHANGVFSVLVDALAAAGGDGAQVVSARPAA